LNAELKKQKINVQKVWDQVGEAVREIVSAKEEFFISEVSFGLELESFPGNSHSFSNRSNSLDYQKAAKISLNL
jgi:hypothetical protein